MGGKRRDFASTDGVMISPDAQIGADTVILGGTIIKDHSDRRDAIGPNSLIQKSMVGDRVNQTQWYQSMIHFDVGYRAVYPYRPNSEIKSFVQCRKRFWG